MRDFLSDRLIVAELVKLVQSWRREAFLAKNLCLEPVWSNCTELVLHVGACWNSKDVVKFC